MTHVPPLAELVVASATVRVWRDHIDSEYQGGFVSTFWPGHGNVELSEQACRECGYRDVPTDGWLRADDPLCQYGLEHDLFHHLIAGYVTLNNYSRVVWGDAHGVLEQMKFEDQNVGWPMRLDDEEHLVNAAQRWFNTEAIDAPHAGLADLIPESDRPFIRSTFNSYLRRSRLRA